MKIVRYIFVIVFISLFFVNAYSQSNDYKVRKCFNYESDSCRVSNNIYYKVHDLSRSALFLKGQTSRTPFSIYNGRDYRISLCWDPILGNHVLFKILDAEGESVLYDNAKDEFSTDFEFTVTQTSDIIIEVTAPKDRNDVGTTGSNTVFFVEKDQSMGCIGVLIEHMITPTKGF